MLRLLLAFAVAGVLVMAGSTDALAGHHAAPSGQTPSPGPTATPSQTPSPTPSPEPSPSEDFPAPDKPGFFDLVGKVRYAISQWFSNLVTSALRPVFDFLGRTVFSTPPLADNGRVAQLWGFSLAIADALLLLLLLVGAGLVTVGGGLGSQLTAKELLPRLVVAAVAANVSLLFLRQMIELSNALSAGLRDVVQPQALADIVQLLCALHGPSCFPRRYLHGHGVLWCSSALLEISSLAISAVLVIGLTLGDLDRGEQVAHRLVEAHRVGSSAHLQVLDSQVIRVPVIVVGQHATARQTHG